jgi:hypothetical protein
MVGWRYSTGPRASSSRAANGAAVRPLTALVVHRPNAFRSRGRSDPWQGSTMTSVDSRSRVIGRRQHGVVTRDQLRRAGISATTIRRRLRSAVWTEPIPGVVDLGTHPASWQGRLQAIVLAAGPEACVSHRTAAYLHGFLDCRRPTRLDVVVPRGRHPRVGGVCLHTTVRLEADEVVNVGGFRSTSGARTLIDLAATQPIPELERLTLDLCRRSPRELARVPQLIGRRPGAPGVAKLWTVLGRLPEGASLLESPLEVLGLAKLNSLVLPSPRLQYQVCDLDGSKLKRVDAAWPDRKVVVEFDGAAYHDTTDQRAADGRTRARLRELGWAVIVLRAADLADTGSGAALERLRRALL